jgi:hypothetical protein
MARITGQTITQLVMSVNEKDVENSYRQYFTRKIPDMTFTSPYGCDGFGVSKSLKLKLLCEFKNKKNLDFSKKLDRATTLSQVIIYIKQFELNGQILPNVNLIADKNKLFVLHTNDIFDYLCLDIDWSIAASDAHNNKYLMDLLMDDETINPFIFSVDQLDMVFDKIKDLSNNTVRKIPITPHNITEVFSYFEKNVLGKHNLNTNQLANLFVQILINTKDNFLHPVKTRKTIVTNSSKEVSVKSRESFTSFFSHFSNDYTPRQKEQLTAVVDRLIQDVTRRKQGEFFTPTIWVNKAHEYITSVFGEDWKKKYVVWDSAWGTGNLTRGYKFEKLYASTLNYSDIQTAEQMGYNSEATKFQFDFLNHSYEDTPKNLSNIIYDETPKITLINPPYATSSDMKQGKNKKGVAISEINKEMNLDKLDRSASQLYAQFFYRASKMENNNICMFSKPTFMTGQVYKEFRKKVLSGFKFKGGFVMDAKDFEGVKSWPLCFSIWEKTKEKTYQQSFKFDIIKKNDLGELEFDGEKIFYNTDLKKPLNRWLKDSIKGKKTFDMPQLSSALTIKPKGYGRLVKDAIGYVIASQNIPQSNGTMNALLSSAFSAKNGISITKENLDKVVIHFAVRKLIVSNWLNEKDEYMAPTEDNLNYEKFYMDSLVYSLFNGSSEQSSLRQITYKDQLWDIKNEFFWMSTEEMMELANSNNYDELYNDVRTDNNRYVHNLLFGEQNIYNQLSPDAKIVLDKATELVRMSMTMRSHFADDHNHLNSWDAGYAQLKLVWKEYFPEEFKEFRQLYKNLEDRMRPLVYELGFLLK